MVLRKYILDTSLGNFNITVDDSFNANFGRIGDIYFINSRMFETDSTKLMIAIVDKLLEWIDRPSETSE